MALRKFTAPANDRFRIRVTFFKAVIKPCQELQLRQEVVRRGAGIHLEPEVLIKELVFQNELTRRPVADIGTLPEAELRRLLGF